MAFKLSEAEIRRKLQRGRNYERLYHELKVKYDAVVAENRELRALVASQQARLDTQAIQIAELQAMVFGKRKPRPPTGKAAPLPLESTDTPPQRDAASYRRAVPPDTAVTAEVVVPLPAACICGGRFGAVSTHVRYEEDIPLPGLTPGYAPHLVTKYQVERAVCRRCGKTASGRDLGGAVATLGPNVRLLVVDLVARTGLSYAQVAQLLLGLYGLRVTDGEIAAVLQFQHRQWLPAYDQLKTDIRAAPTVHVDETPWPIQELQGAGYAWDFCDAGSEAVCFALENSRGARHAQDMFGQGGNRPFAGIRVSDDYGPYRSAVLPGVQQLCWSHLHRTVRDLAGNASLPDAQLPYVRQWYDGFAGIYADLRHCLAEPYDRARRQAQAAALWSRLRQLIRSRPVAAGEPEKLTRLKAQLIRAGKERLFVCLTADAPCDNNRAERDLRSLVCKRKRSFGSKTQKGAQALATVLSLCTTTWRRAQAAGNPAGYFSSLAALAG